MRKKLNKKSGYLQVTNNSKNKKSLKSLRFQVFFGAPAGIRTPDTLLKRQVLCLLSYWGVSL